MVVAVVALVALLVWSRNREVAPDDKPVVPAVTLTPLEQLRAAVQVEAATVQNPWVLAHTLLALGADAQVNGASVRETLNGFVRTGPAGPHFDLMTPSGLGEVHPHLVLKVLAETHPDDPLVAHLMQTAFVTFERPLRFEGWNDAAWLLEALGRRRVAANTPLGQHGERVDTVYAGAVLQLQRAQTVVDDLLQQQPFRRPAGDNSPDVGGVWSYTCGGQHLLHAVLFAQGGCPGLPPLTDGFPIKTFLKRLEAEYQFRIAEREHAVAQGVNSNEALRRSSVALLKLLGHGLETLAYARDNGIGDAEQLQKTALQTRTRLLGVLEELASKIDLRKLFAAARNQASNDWLLWFGDGCHALHGLRLWH